MNILITGSEGFVGKNLVEDLSELTSHTILAPTFLELDLSDIDVVDNYFKKNEINVVVHSATTLRNKTDYPDDVCEKNLKMFFNILKVASKDTTIINFGSGSEYSRANWTKKMKETYFDKSVPMDGHSYAKYLISKYIDESTRDNLTTIRIFGIFGKYEDYRFKFISNAIAKNIKELPIVINQDVEYDYLYIKDFSKIIIELIKLKKFKYSAYNVTPTNSISIVNVVNTINKISNTKSKIIVLNEGKGTDYSGDNSRLLEELQDFKFSSYEESISELYQHYLQNEDMIDKKELEADEYLNYAKSLKKNYFDKKSIS